MPALLIAKAALLQVLERPGHGLELIRRIRVRTRDRMDLKQGSVYPALRQLEDEGLVRAWKGLPPQGGGRPRTYFELTLRGVRAASEQRETVASLIAWSEPDKPSPREIEQMQERLRRCAEVSAFCRDLRQAFLRTGAS